METTPRFFQLWGTCNNYPWGAKGQDSLAARLLESASPTSFEIDNEQFYSELWFGDYPDFPGKVENGRTLQSVLINNKEQLLGAYTIGKFGDNLPFLPKILSIAKALPLQIHPNKALAAKLHRKDPDKFSDPNHKPEIAIALSRLELFVGWKELDQISPLFKMSYLRRFVPDGTQTWSYETLRGVIRNILKADEATIQMVEEALKLQFHDLVKNTNYNASDQLLELISRLQSQYSASDPGLLVAILCMNFLVLEPGQAVFIPADGIHCYLSGDLFECMARSNNMLASGLCPTADRDNADLFCDTLIFDTRTHLDNIKLPATPSNASARESAVVYSPPIGEFDVLKIDVESKIEELVAGQKGPTVAIVITGKGKILADGQEIAVKPGVTVFIAAGTAAMITAEEHLQLYAATVR